MVCMCPASGVARFVAVHVCERESFFRLSGDVRSPPSAADFPFRSSGVIRSRLGPSRWNIVIMSSGPMPMISLMMAEPPETTL